ncbi:hypothetical protein Bca4012_011059 [Brassica carinata]
MAMVTPNPVRQLNDVKPFKDAWKVEIKVLHSWAQHSSYAGGNSIDFILADKTGVKIHCTCKKNFFPRVKKLLVGEWKFIENFKVTPATGKYRPTSHKYKISITASTNVSNSGLKMEDDFLTLTPLQSIINGSLDANFLVGQVQITNAFDISSMVINPTGFDVQDYPAMVPNNELAISSGSGEIENPKTIKRQTEKWSLYPERSILDILMSTEATVYAIDTDWTWYHFACVKCNYKKVDDPEDLPDAINALIGRTFKFGVHVGKDNVDYGADIFTIGGTWSENEIISESEDDNTLDSTHSSGQVSLLSNESETRGATSTPVSKRSGSSMDSQIGDLSSTSKKQRFKNIKLEKNGGE